jgi:2-(1,2-epoxy-1,2-dihydrophenyl)acetyl-CoA isomerase
MLNASDSLNLKQVLELEGEMQNIAASTEDFQEGIISFQQKRKPSFKGK